MPTVAASGRAIGRESGAALVVRPARDGARADFRREPLESPAA